MPLGPPPPPVPPGVHLAAGVRAVAAWAGRLTARDLEDMPADDLARLRDGRPPLGVPRLDSPGPRLDSPGAGPVTALAETYDLLASRAGLLDALYCRGVADGLRGTADLDHDHPEYARGLDGGRGLRAALTAASRLLDEILAMVVRLGPLAPLDDHGDRP